MDLIEGLVTMLIQVNFPQRDHSDTSIHIRASYCGMYVPLTDDKHRKVRDSSKKCTGNLRQFSPRQNAVQDKIQSKIFFSNGQEKIFFRLNFVSD